MSPLNQNKWNKLGEKRKVYLPFCSFCSLESAQGHSSLAKTFADNDWTCKRMADEWELSTCSCKDWLKNYKCDHVIAVCSRLNLFHIKELAMNIPLERKCLPDRPKATTNALTRQPNETQNVNDLGINVYEESDTDDPPEQEPISNKIRLEETPIVSPQPKLKKNAVDQLDQTNKKKIKKKSLFFSSANIHIFFKTSHLTCFGASSVKGKANYLRICPAR
ncbi:hypothetical protein BpHYR1_000806 [Brachionus plicatilis]|uniref:SWIM-type domain-containing protein n=1 Tax=Brachionus plicatilis TaxID=10195 RepID=A0A3M7PKK7_BRAPC|nr:hypothetical protein BpHYR1_000806 [Brachionus plicatilis]